MYCPRCHNPIIDLGEWETDLICPTCYAKIVPDGERAGRRAVEIIREIEQCIRWHHEGIEVYAN